MVKSGFNLLDVRHMYLDELLSYHNELVYLQEKAGELKDGAYDKVTRKEDDTVSQLRKQIFRIKK